jgi:protein-tyrosine phosphatase
LAGFSPAVRGDQPSEILPGLFLGGHPARFVKKGGGFPSYPHGSVHEKTGSTLIVNCCAAPSAAPHIIECVKDGTKTFHESSADCFAQAACDDQLVVVHNVAMVDDDEYPIGNDIHAVCRALAAALVPQWRAALESEAPGPSRIRGAFVHCQMGVSRSATVVIAFLMWAFGLDLEAALAFAETRRRCVSPNPGFHSMLRAF